MMNKKELYVLLTFVAALCSADARAHWNTIPVGDFEAFERAFDPNYEQTKALILNGENTSHAPNAARVREVMNGVRVRNLFAAQPSQRPSLSFLVEAGLLSRENSLFLSLNLKDLSMERTWFYLDPIEFYDQDSFQRKMQRIAAMAFAQYDQDSWDSLVWKRVSESRSSQNSLFQQFYEEKQIMAGILPAFQNTQVQGLHEDIARRVAEDRAEGGVRSLLYQATKARVLQPGADFAPSAASLETEDLRQGISNVVRTFAADPEVQTAVRAAGEACSIQ